MRSRSTVKVSALCAADHLEDRRRGREGDADPPRARARGRGDGLRAEPRGLAARAPRRAGRARAGGPRRDDPGRGGADARRRLGWSGRRSVYPGTAPRARELPGDRHREPAARSRRSATRDALRRARSHDGPSRAADRPPRSEVAMGQLQRRCAVDVLLAADPRAAAGGPRLRRGARSGAYRAPCITARRSGPRWGASCRASRRLADGLRHHGAGLHRYRFEDR